MYEIHGKSNFGTEVIDTDIGCKHEAQNLLWEYQLAFGQGWELWIEKVG